MKLFRSIVFWLHLACGIVAGLVIGIMSFTGVALAFEKETIAFAERDARRVTPPGADARHLPLDELVRRAGEARPDYRPTNLVILADPNAAIALSTGGGRGGAGGASSLYANPYTGEIRAASSPRTQAFMRAMRSWHRWLGVEGEHRNVARAVTGACNLAFLGLGVSGLYLWWPRSWSWRAVRAISLFNGKLAGKARDFNWHNVIGLWSAPMLIVLTATALPMSYIWAGNLIYKLTGTPAPAAGAGPGGSGAGLGALAAIAVSRPPEGVQPLGYEALVAVVKKENPAWEQITLRIAGGPTNERGGASPGPEGRGGQGGSGGRGNARGPRGEFTGGGGAGRGEPVAAEMRPATSELQPVALTLKQSNTWPRTATTTLSIDPYTGATLRRSGYANMNAAQQVRAWTRFLHTGEALGWAGQLVAGLASAGGCLLMYTGLALAWRRFFGKRPAPVTAEPAENRLGSVVS